MSIGPISQPNWHIPLSQPSTAWDNVKNYRKGQDVAKFWENIGVVLIEMGGARFLEPFNWTASEWMEESKTYIVDPENFKNADLEMLCKLYLTQMRVERYCEGHLESLIEDGHAANFVQRLKELRQS